MFHPSLEWHLDYIQQSHPLRGWNFVVKSYIAECICIELPPRKWRSGVLTNKTSKEEKQRKLGKILIPHAPTLVRLRTPRTLERVYMYVRICNDGGGPTRSKESSEFSHVNADSEHQEQSRRPLPSYALSPKQWRTASKWQVFLKEIDNKNVPLNHWIGTIVLCSTCWEK